MAKALVLRLAPEDFARLESEARRLGVRPGTAARILLRERLGEDRARKKRGLETLEELGRIAQRAGPIEASAFVAEGRRDLEQRGSHLA